ncbi:MAG: hypothetical protein NTY32_02385 [Bacteroidia bacterium]|nr:hypothetical protein [Bacteroidia bacterium]
MDIQTKKLKLIEEFLSISDEKLIDNLDLMIQKVKLKGYEESLKPMSLIELRDMVEESISDYKNGDVISQEDFEKEISTWK